MQPINFPEANRTFTKPEGWTDDQCQPLPIHDTGEALVSCWQPDEAERARLAAGAPVQLTVVGRGHPPVLLEVRGDAPVPVEIPVSPDVRVEKLEVGPGSVVVVTLPGEIPPEHMQSTGALLSEKLRGTGALALVMQGGGHVVALDGLQPEDRAALFAAVDAWRAAAQERDPVSGR